MGIFSNESGYTQINFNHLEGLPNYSKLCPTTVILEYHKVIFQPCFPSIYKAPEITLQYDQIVNAGKTTETEIVESNKSVIGRAAVGGLLLGGLGAIVGGMSGVGKKKKKVIHEYFVINYRPQGAEDVRVILFEFIDGFGTTGFKKFFAELAQKAGIEPPQNPDPNTPISL